MIIGIDFSINSTAITISNEKGIVMMSFVPNYESGKSAWKVHDAISKFVQIHSYKKDGSSKNSIEDQRIKLRNANNLSDQIINAIGAENLKRVEKINIEGFSYASKGNSFIDLITYNTFLKTKLFQIVGDKIFVVPPKTLKKWYTGNGNATKCGMLRSYLEKNNNDLTSKIREVCKIEDGEFNIPKPLDDLVDSIALSELAEGTLQ
jgi:hypothetical protein